MFAHIQTCLIGMDKLELMPRLLERKARVMKANCGSVNKRHNPMTIDTEEMDPDPWEQLSRQEKEEDKRIIAMATERFDKAFDLIFGGREDEPA